MLNKSYLLILSLAMLPLAHAEKAVTGIVDNSSMDSVDGTLSDSKTADEFVAQKNRQIAKKLNTSKELLNSMKVLNNEPVGGVVKGSDSFKSFSDAVQASSAVDELSSAMGYNDQLTKFYDSQAKVITAQKAFQDAKKSLDATYKNGNTLQVELEKQEQLGLQMISKIKDQDLQIKRLEQNTASLINEVAKLKDNMSHAPIPKSAEQAVRKTSTVQPANFVSSNREQLSDDYSRFRVQTISIIKLSQDNIKKKAQVFFSADQRYAQNVVEGDTLNGWKILEITSGGVKISKNEITQFIPVER